MKTPKFWKMVLLNFAVVYPTLEAIKFFLLPVLGPILTQLPPWADDAVMVLLMCLVLSYVLPKANLRLHAWLVR